MERVSRAVGKLRASPAMYGSIAAVCALTFAGMVSAAYTADHIKRSTCPMTDDKVKNAYKWSWVTAVLAGSVSAGMAGLLVKGAFF